MDDIYEKIEKYSDLVFGIDTIALQKQELIDSILSPEIKAKLAEIDAEFDPQSEKLANEKAQLETEIKKEVVATGYTIKGIYHEFRYSKPRVTWLTDALDGYAEAHPEIKQFRKTGDPSVSVRKV